MLFEAISFYRRAALTQQMQAWLSLKYRGEKAPGAVRAMRGNALETTVPLEIITWNIPENILCEKIYITYSFIVDNPNILGHFCCLLGRTNWERIT